MKYGLSMLLSLNPLVDTDWTTASALEAVEVLEEAFPWENLDCGSELLMTAAAMMRVWGWMVV